MSTMNPTLDARGRGHGNPPASTTARAGALVYGVLSYAIGIGGLVWLMATALGVVQPTGGPVAFDSTAAAIAFDLALIAVFGVQHAIMARPAFKARWTRVVPPAIERSTFVLVTGVLVSAMMWLWQPLEASVWAVESPVLAVGLRAVACLGWAYLLLASFAIDHFELFGLKQVWSFFRGVPMREHPVVTRMMYRFDRHPLMTGMLVGVWCTPAMTLGHLVLALGLTTYIVVGVAIEESTLVQVHGEGYREYRRRVPALVPFPGRRG